MSSNIKDVLKVITRMIDKDTFSQLEGYSPTAPDTYFNYLDAQNSINNVLSGFNNSYDKLNNRGSWSLNYVSTTDPANGGVTLWDANAVANVQNLWINFDTTEPLLMSPWICNKPASNNAGIYGISTMTFQMTMGNGRSFRSAYTDPALAVGLTATVVKYQDSSLRFNFITAHPSDLLNPRNVIPFSELPVYKTASGKTFSALTLANAGAPPVQQTIETTSITLNQIPDKLIIYVQDPNPSITSSDSFFVINAISINWNNNSGVLSSSSIQDLHRYSVEAGSQQSFLEYSGFANMSFPLAAGGAANAGLKIPTSGSLLCLNFGQHIPIVEDFLSAGSLGQFVLQIRLSVSWQQTLYSTAPNRANRVPPPPNVSPEVVVVTMLSGLLVLERGVCSVFTGLLTRADVMEANEQTAISKSTLKRLIGGNWFDDVKSVFTDKIKPIFDKVAPVAKNILNSIDNPYTKGVATALGAMGYAKKPKKLKDRIM
jgi:hypothetical protein